MEPPFPSISEQHHEQPCERLLLTTLAAFCSGDLAARMSPAHDAVPGRLAAEVDRWLDAASSVLRAFDSVVANIVEGRLVQPMPLEVNGHPLRGQLLGLAERINRMRAQLTKVTSEIGRITHEVSVEGRLGGQAALPGPESVWRDLGNHVNSLVTRLTSQVRAMSEVTAAMANGDFSVDLQMTASGEFAQLRDNINALIQSLRESKHCNAEQDWLKTNVARLTKQLQGQRSIAAVAGMLMSELAPLINIQHGLFYLMDDVHQMEQPRMRLYASYAAALEVRAEWRLGEGLIGQCALDRRPLLITDVPPAYLTVRTGIGAAAPCCLLIQPILFEGEVRAVLELASFSGFTAIQRSFLTQLAEATGIVLHTIASSTRTENLLRQAQSLAQELQSQQEALSKSNAELHEKAVLLERQKAAIEAKNHEVEMTRMSLEEKAEQLMLSSRYKSEFLSNMSHELRTPLNSLLILARQLSENAECNLTPRQVEYAQTIYSAGGDLLGMINEILDLAKIESGTVVLEQRDVSFSALEEQVLRMFNPVAQSRQLDFSVTRSPLLPATIRTDEVRLLQVIRNLLSNAFKFTEHGSVTLSIKPVPAGWHSGQPALDAADMVIAFEVCDTGIGVAPQQQQLIFEAFRQADTSTSRRYGGTGLGLSISTDLARLMQGELRLLFSEPAKGSSFALYIPLHPRPGPGPENTSNIRAAAPMLAATMPVDSDDRDRLLPGDKVLLLIGAAAESAAAFLLAAHAHGCRGLVAQRGADGLELLKRHPPGAIVLDAHRLDIDGWRLLAAIKRDDAIRHLPLHVVCAPGDALRALQEGASMCSSPPSAGSMHTIVPALLRKAARHRRRLLLIGDDAAALDRLQSLLAGNDLLVRVSALSQLPSALRRRTDCIVLHLAGADARPALALDAARQHGVNSQSPLLIYMPQGLPLESRQSLLTLERQTLVCRVHTDDRLLDDSALFLHRDLMKMSQAQRQRISALHQGSHALSGRTVLIVDDDIRNVFALTGMLEHHGMTVCSAENGREAIDLLHGRQACDIILMDIMMPDMDGFDTMREIRRHAAFDALPIIALTAKAMKGDRDKCLAAGASDYVSKPVDIEELLALMRCWLHR